MSRSCGECSMCCRLPEIPELNKPAGQWCQFVQIDQKGRKSGCAAYESRPEPCRQFACLWLVNPTWPDDARPDRSGVVMFFPEEKGWVHALCDPRKPEAWQKGFMRRMIEQLVRHNLKIRIRTGEAMTTLEKETV